MTDRAAVASLLLLAPAGCASPSDDTVGAVLTVRLENVGGPQAASCGAYDLLVAPGLYVLAGGGTPLFQLGAPAPEGLEALAEDGDPEPLRAAVAAAGTADEAAVFDMPDGTYESAAIQPGERFSFEVTARPGQRLFLAGMYVQSNDLFVATPPEGIALFDGDAPMTGDRSDALDLYDAGTEVNEEPGCGSDQAPRQATEGAGDPESEPVARAADRGDGFTYPELPQILKLTVETTP